MRLTLPGLVGCLLGLSTFGRSGATICPTREVWKRDGGHTCIIDLREHQVTQALGGSKHAYYTTPSSECEKLYKIMDQSEQLWESGDRNQSVALFYQVYSPQASQDEIQLVQAHLDGSRGNTKSKRDNVINELVFGSIVNSDKPAFSSDEVIYPDQFGLLPWRLSPRHQAGINVVRDLAFSFVTNHFGPYVNGCCPRSDCLNGACLSWAVDIPNWYSPLGADYINDLLSRYPGSSMISAHSWDTWGKRGTVCVSNRPDGCTNHG